MVAIKLLREAEWASRDGQDNDACCPWCRARECLNARGPYGGHEKGCPWWALMERLGCMDP